MKNKQSFGYSSKTTTKIWQEIPSKHNPYVARENRLHGYDLIELATQKNFVDVLFLLFMGELPTTNQSTLLNTLMIGLISPGPRHSATRSAMVAGISKTNTSHILPIGLLALGGTNGGSNDVEAAMAYIKNNIGDSIANLDIKEKPISGDWFPIPGIGSYYGDSNLYCNEFANEIIKISAPNGAASWLNQIIKEFQESKNASVGWLNTGIAAAVLYDLGFPSREGNSFYQIISAPGIAAHGLEQTHRPIRAMPFIEDSQYDYQK